MSLDCNDVDVMSGEGFQLVETDEAVIHDVNRHAECFGYLLNGLYLTAEGSVLDAPYVGAVESGAVGQFLLAQSCGQSQSLDALPYPLAGFFFRAHSSL